MSSPAESSKSEKPESGTGDWEEYGKFRGRVLHREKLADNVHEYIVDKLEGFTFRPGQAVKLGTDK